ncbi:MAG: pyridoxamine 5'-phosphate oxidase family protein [Nitrospirae bacterium]|nr:pyridoxamine 5'-phosphate oxidase family protein [Nitrospirota bacterium]
MNLYDELNAYLKSQILLTVATLGKEYPWTCSVYFGYSDGRFYFTSKRDTQHAKDIGNGAIVAFAVADSAQTPSAVIVGVQGRGFCRPARLDDATKIVVNYGQKFKEFLADYGSLPNLLEVMKGGTVYVIEAHSIKFTNKNLFKDAQILSFDLRA